MIILEYTKVIISRIPFIIRLMPIKISQFWNSRHNSLNNVTCDPFSISCWVNLSFLSMITQFFELALLVHIRTLWICIFGPFRTVKTNQQCNFEHFMITRFQIIYRVLSWKDNRTSQSRKNECVACYLNKTVVWIA